jgi:hypothetical protein
MRAAVLCLNFPGVALAFSTLQTGNTTRGNKMLSDGATNGNAEIVNVLKTQTEIRGGAAVGQADVR